MENERCRAWLTRPQGVVATGEASKEGKQCLVDNLCRTSAGALSSPYWVSAQACSQAKARSAHSNLTNWLDHKRAPLTASSDCAHPREGKGMKRPLSQVAFDAYTANPEGGIFRERYS